MMFFKQILFFLLLYQSSLITGNILTTKKQETLKITPREVSSSNDYVLEFYYSIGQNFFKNCAFIIFSYGSLRQFEVVLHFADSNSEPNIIMRFQKK